MDPDNTYEASQHPTTPIHFFCHTPCRSSILLATTTQRQQQIPAGNMASRSTATVCLVLVAMMAISTIASADRMLLQTGQAARTQRAQQDTQTQIRAAVKAAPRPGGTTTQAASQSGVAAVQTTARPAGLPLNVPTQTGR